MVAGWQYRQQHVAELPLLTGRIESEDVRTNPDGNCRDWKGIAEQVRSIMWEKVGIIRQGEELAKAAAELEQLRQEVTCLAPSRDAVEAVNLLTLGRLTVSAALIRTESRGGHFRSDFPSRDDVYWLRHIVFQI